MKEPTIIYTGEQVIDQAKTAAAAKEFREKADVLITSVASVMDCSITHVYLLEKAKRRWTADLFNLYTNAVKSLKNEQPAAGNNLGGH